MQILYQLKVYENKSLLGIKIGLEGQLELGLKLIRFGIGIKVGSRAKRGVRRRVAWRARIRVGRRVGIWIGIKAGRRDGFKVWKESWN